MTAPEAPASRRSPRRALLVVAAGSALVVAAVPVLAVLGAAPAAEELTQPWSGEVVAAPPPNLPDSADAVHALVRAARAARSTGFAGVAAVQDWGGDGGVARLLDVVRVPGSGTLVRVRGAAGTAESTRVTSDTDGPTASPADSGRVLGLLARNFAVSLAGSDTVAGRPASVVLARRADDRTAARFWLDRATGLVLRREVYDSAGRIAQAAAFLSLQPATERELPAADAAAVRAAVAATAGSRASGGTADIDPPMTKPVDSGAIATMRGQGWACPQALPEGLVLFDVRQGTTQDGAVLQMVYSDGLATVSLFEQRGQLAADRLDGFQPADVGGTSAWTRPGSPTQVVWQSGGSVLTLVADAPADLVAAVVAALPGSPPASDGWVQQVRRGWDRLLRAVIPGD